MAKNDDVVTRFLADLAKRREQEPKNPLQLQADERAKAKQVNALAEFDAQRGR